MEKEYRIKNFDDLIEFIETQDLPLKDFEEIVRQTLGVIVLLGDNYEKGYLIEKLKDFRNKFGPGQERPIFLMDGLDCLE